MEVNSNMFKKVLGAVTVMTVTFSTLGMGYPQENTLQTAEFVKALDTTQATEAFLTLGAQEARREAVSIKAQGKQSVQRIADEQAKLQDSPMLLAAGVVEKDKRKTAVTPEELLLLQKVVSAESRGESQEAQYTVACVILNRIESPMFPDTLEGVVRQNAQFTCVGNGIINNVPITESVEQAVAMALDNNTVDENVLWFRSSRYHNFFQPVFQIGKMYFSAA